MNTTPLDVGSGCIIGIKEMIVFLTLTVPLALIPTH